jgi:hypothetical protein
MTTIINGSSPSITFSDSTTQSTGLPAPSTSGNVLTSNGTVWVSQAASGGGFSGATTTSSAANITLTSTSKQIQNITMTAAGLYVILPDATTVTAGSGVFQIINNGTINFGIKDNAGNILGYNLTAGQISIINLVNNSTAAGVWAINQDFSSFTNSAPMIVNSVSSETVTSNVIQVQLLSATSFIIVYRSGTAVKAIGGTISGSTVTYGTAISITGATTDAPGGIYIAKTSATTAVAAWTISTNNTFKAVSLSLSGTTITGGTPSTVASDPNGGMRSWSLFSLNGTTAIFAFSQDDTGGGGGNYSKSVRAGTSSGTTLTLGTAVTLTTADAGSITAGPISSTAFITAFSSGSTPVVGICSVSGTTITAGTGFTGTNAVSSFGGGTANVSSTQALMGNYLVTYSTTTISSIASLQTSVIGSPNTLVGTFQHGAASNGVSNRVGKQFITSTGNANSIVNALSVGNTGYAFSSDNANYIAYPNINSANTNSTVGSGVSYAGIITIKVA